MILRAAAVCSVDPGPFTFGELLSMLELRERSEWARTSSLMCLLANINAPKGKSFDPGDFNPYQETQREYIDAKDLGAVLGFKRSKE